MENLTQIQKQHLIMCGTSKCAEGQETSEMTTATSTSFTETIPNPKTGDESISTYILLAVVALVLFALFNKK